MDQNNIIESGGFYFIHNFDSGNLGHVERVPTELIVPSVVNQKTNTIETPDYEFNLWTRPDCAGTEFENGNRTWFYFGIQASEPNVLVRLNLINLNKQGKMYNQGMAPVTRTLPGKPQWERIRDRPVHSTDDNTFTLSFKYKTSDNVKATTFFAFTYPFSFAELQIALNSIDMKMLPLPPPQTPDDIYYCRECLIYSLEGRRVDLLTISSHHNITTEREDRLRNLFPDNQERPFKFQNKKVIFISARVHPGETPSSFVFNGFLNLLLNRHDPIAIQLRKFYVFKMIPFLNPDGVARGHYRTDTRGVNLNRVYLNPSLALHPTVYASRALIRFYHYGCEKEDALEDSKSFTSRSIQNIAESVDLFEKKKKGTQVNVPYKSVDLYKKELKGKQNSATTIKQPSDSSSKRDSIKINPGEASNLAEQVCDMTLREMPSQTSDMSSQKSNTNLEPSLLNEQVLRSCLGSTVHLSTSEELNFHGTNPLRPLRDALKNSISLLMESSSSNAGDSTLSGKDSRLTNVKMGWCRDCRSTLSRLEDISPGLGPLASSLDDFGVREPQTYASIEEYREHQKKQIEIIEENKQAAEQESTKALDETVNFCTNCFKRYLLTENNEEIVCDTVSVASVAVSAGDAGSLVTELEKHSHNRPAPDLGDTLQSAPTKEDKPRVAKKGKGKPVAKQQPAPAAYKEPESGLYLYIDLHGHASKKGILPCVAIGGMKDAGAGARYHGLLLPRLTSDLVRCAYRHASKKGIFMYGNHFEDLERCVECMLLPRIMSLNNLHFHFSSCNFTERNMYLKDRRDGMSREGSGRVAVLKATGLVRSYTLECNYNTGRLVNVLPPTVREGNAPCPITAPTPPKYTPHIFEEVNPFQAKPVRKYFNLEVYGEMNAQEVGRSLGASILDLTGQHPNSRIPCSEHRNLAAVREWLRAHTKTMRPQLTMSRLRPKTASPPRVPLYARSKAKVTEERKENAYSRPEASSAAGGALTQRSQHDIVALNVKFGKRSTHAPRPRYLDEPKPKSLAAKRRNVLALRKPNASKTQVGGGKARLCRRSADEAESGALGSRLSKRSFPRRNRCRALASSSSSSEREVPPPPAANKRRPYPPAPPAAHLKKLRLKTTV